MKKQIFLVLMLTTTLALAQVDFLLIKDGFGTAGQALDQPIEIILANQNTLRGLQFDIEYDASVLSVDSISPGAGFEDFNIFSNEIETGRLRFLVTDFNGSVISPSSGPLLVIDGALFENIEPHGSALKLRNISLIDSSGVTTSTADAGGYVFVTGLNFLRVANGYQKLKPDTIDVLLHNQLSLGGVQFKLKFDAAFISLIAVQKTVRSQRMDIQTNEINSDEMVVVLTSISADSISKGTGSVAQLIVQPVLEKVGSQLDAVQPINLEDLVLSDTRGNVLNAQTFDGTFLLQYVLLPPVFVGEAIQNYSPEEFTLSQNYPNPFNPETEITYSLPIESRVELTIYNFLGQEIKKLVEAFKPAGNYTATWDGRDNNGNQVTSGLYLYKLQARDKVQVRKMLVVR